MQQHNCSTQSPQHSPLTPHAAPPVRPRSCASSVQRQRWHHQLAVLTALNAAPVQQQARTATEAAYHIEAAVQQQHCGGAALQQSRSVGRRQASLVIWGAAASAALLDLTASPHPAAAAAAEAAEAAAAAAAGTTATGRSDPRLAPLTAFWQQLVAFVQPQLGSTFSPALVFYGPAAVLPSGTPGDPAAESNRAAAAACGAFSSGFHPPYACCPATFGDVPADDTARSCCRHVAFAVPRSRYAFAAVDRQSAVVASPRLALAPAHTWQGVLVHEMGHCIDFFSFASRYRLPDEPPVASAAAAAALAAINATEPDPELRADRMASALLAPLLGKQLCYDSRSTVQQMVSPDTVCVPEPASGDTGGSGDVVFWQHFPHAPVSR